MNFGKNLQAIRKSKSLSQEELADKMNVSRQAISKWESGGAYPEMEKLVELAGVLDCSVDELLRGEMKVVKNGNLKTTYDKLMNSFSIWVSVAIGMVMLGMVSLLALQDFGAPYDGYGLVALLIMVAVSVPIFVVNGIRLSNFKEKHPKLEQFYTEKEIDKYTRRFMTLIASAIVIIMAGLVVFIGAETSEVFLAESSLPAAVFMMFVAVGAPIFVFAGIRKSKYNITSYNHENSAERRRESELIGKISGVIMMVATIVFMLVEFIWQIWEFAWIVFPIGGILCGIVAVILQKDK